MHPFKFEIYALRAARRFLKTQGGYVSTLSAVCDKEAQEQIECLPEVGNYMVFGVPVDVYEQNPDAFERLYNVMRDVCLTLPEKDEPAPRAAQEKGDFGHIPQAIYRAGIPDVLPVRAALGIAHDATTEQAFAAIREHVASYWEQPSSTFVDAEGWREWAESVGIGKYIVPVLAQKERE